MAGTVIDRAMQSYGAEGVSQDTPLAKMAAGLRTLRFADGPDEVHIQQIGKRELERAKRLRQLAAEVAKKEAQLLKARGLAKL
ncbi:putative acyl-CoA dehydrogenase ibr3 [Serendipita sp. 411]|nr:putative acyl-CoA dehydrogenase ibr3 [Serendipita sp. 401]KAG8845096.1 putative acyl-CoA dehydrogenase ibr3 [Serendipita sp. 411]